jgi:hypothetical protein
MDSTGEEGWDGKMPANSTSFCRIYKATIQPDFTFWYTETPKRAANTDLYILKIRVIGSSQCNPCTLFPAGADTL